MPSHQLRLVRQRRRRKTVEWKQKLDSRLCFKDATLDMCRCMLHSISLSFAFVSPILALGMSAIPEFVSHTAHLQSVEVSAALFGMALQLSLLCGALGPIVNPPTTTRYQLGWHARRPLPPPGRPWTIFVLGATPRTVFLGLDPEVTVRDVMADLRRRRLIPDLSRVDHYLTFPPCRYHDGHLQPHERLMDLGVVNLSTLYLKSRCMPGGSSSQGQENRQNSSFPRKRPSENAESTSSTKRLRPLLDSTFIPFPPRNIPTVQLYHNIAAYSTPAELLSRTASLRNPAPHTQSASEVIQPATDPVVHIAPSVHDTPPPVTREADYMPTASHPESTFHDEDGDYKEPDLDLDDAASVGSGVSAPPWPDDTRIASPSPFLHPSVLASSQAVFSTTPVFADIAPTPLLEPMIIRNDNEPSSNTMVSAVGVREEGDIAAGVSSRPPMVPTDREADNRPSFAVGGDWEATLDWAATADFSDLNWMGMSYFDIPETDAGLLGENVLASSTIGADVYVDQQSVGKSDRFWLNDDKAGAEDGGEDDLDFFDDEVDAGFEDYEAESESLNTPHAHTPTLLPGVPLPAPILPAPAPTLERTLSPDPSHTDVHSPEPNKCQYRGVACSCTEASHLTDHSLSASSPLHVDQSCEILKLLGLSFHRYHRYLICTCGCFLPMGNFIDHFKKAHPDKLRDSLSRYANKELRPVIRHFVASFGVSADQSIVEFTASTFNGPIAGIAKPVMRPTCVACGLSLKNDDVVKSHWRTSCKGDRDRNLPRSQRTELKFAQRPFFVSKTGNKSGTYVAVPHDLPLDGASISSAQSGNPVSQAERYSVPKGTDSFVPPWLEGLGWSTWRDDLVKAGISVEAMRSFSELPPQLFGKKRPTFSSPPTEAQTFDWVARRIRIRLVKMMEDANSFLKTANGELRANLTAKTRSRFREISTSSYDSYARIIQRMVLVLVRWKHQPTGIPRLPLPRTRRQDTAISAMHDFVYQTNPLTHPDEDDTYDQALDVVLLELLEAVYYQELQQTESAASVFDVIMIILCLNPDGSFSKASYVTHVCAIHQYMIRVTAAHSLRLFKLGMTHYVPLTATNPPSDGIINDGDDHFLTRFQEVQKYILPSSENQHRSTPFSRCKFIWLRAARGVRAERSAVKLSWTPDLREFEYSRPGSSKFRITLLALQDMLRGIENGLLQDFDKLLPSTFDSAAVNRLPWDTLRDDATTPESFIDREDTWDSWLGPAVTALKLAYLDKSEMRHRLTADSIDGSPSLAAFDKLLDLDRHFQESLVGELVSSTGISPRVTTLRDYRFRADGKGLRNLFMTVDSIVLEGGKQKGESRRDGYREFVIRALTPRAGLCLVRYLALVRLALVELMEENHWHTNVVGTYKTHLFARTSRKEAWSGAWEPQQITAAWHKMSFPYISANISIVDVRQYATGIYEKLFPVLLDDGSTQSGTQHINAVDRQGDHTKSVRVNHYGRSDALCNGNSEPDTRDFIRSSRVWQAAMQAFSVDKSWPDSVVSSLLKLCQ